MRLPAFVRLAAVTSVLMILCAACGTTLPTPIGTQPSAGTSVVPSSPPAASPSPSLGPLLLKVTSEGGFINPAATLAAMPTVAVYTDGRILTPGASPAIGPGRLVPRVAVRNVGPSGATAILDAIKRAGLDKPATGGPGVPGDAGTTIFTVVVDGTTTTTRLVAGGGPPGPGRPGASGSPGAEPRRAAAFALLNRLVDPAETWGAGAAPEKSFAPAGYRMFVAPGAPPADPSAPQHPVAWPLSANLDAFGTPAVPDRGIVGLRQGAVLGDDAVRLGPILSAATTATPFTSAGKTYTLYVRPLFPDEAGG